MSSLRRLLPSLLLIAIGVQQLVAPKSVATEKLKPRNGDKVLIVNDDGYSNFYSGKHKTSDDLRKHGLRLQDTQVAVLEWCITSGSRTNFPCKTAELIGSGVTEFGRRCDKLIAEGKLALPERGTLSATQHRDRADRWYREGADGVHLFNVGNIAVMKTLGNVSR